MRISVKLRGSNVTAAREWHHWQAGSSPIRVDLRRCLLTSTRRYHIVTIIEHVSDALRLDPSLGCRPSDADWHDHDALTLDNGDIDLLSDTDTLSALDSLRKLRARAGAIEARLLARFESLRDDAPGTDDEVAYALRITRHQAADRRSQANQLVHRHPVLLAAMHDGDVEPFPASRVLDLTVHLDDETARQVDERLVGRLAGKNPTEVRRVARRAVHAVDPDGLADRARRARTGRKVELLPGEDTMSRLNAQLPAEAASAAYNSIDAEARRRRRQGDDRTLDQLRADILIHRLLRPGNALSGETNDCANGTTSGLSPAAMVYLHMPIDAALGITDDGCELAGYGQIPGPIARHIMCEPGSIWRKVICDPATGAPRDLGRSRYRPNATIREVIHARDRECAIPGCHRTAQHCHFDHVRSHSTGGDTSVDNGEAACAYHNNLKEEPGWRIEFSPDGTTATIITPTGQRITRRRRPVLKPRATPKPATPKRGAATETNSPPEPSTTESTKPPYTQDTSDASNTATRPAGIPEPRQPDDPPF
ncbi:HNH endonuclease signature motif containing protein [Haloechinothrix salitolerans]